MPPSRSQADYRAQWTSLAEALARRARDLAREVPTARLNRAPPTGGWSAAQVFEHLVIANESYLALLRRVAAGAARRAPPGAAWKASIAGGWLVRSFQSRRRLPAPQIYRPPQPRPDVTEAFAAGMLELIQLLDRLAATDWRRVRLRSPVSGLVRLNLGDCFAIVVHHAERHFRQIERALGNAGATPKR